MPVRKCSNGKYRIGSGDCMYKSKASADRAYKGYLGAKHMNEGKNKTGQFSTSFINAAGDEYDINVDFTFFPGRAAVMWGDDAHPEESAEIEINNITDPTTGKEYDNWDMFDTDKLEMEVMEYLNDRGSDERYEEANNTLEEKVDLKVAEVDEDEMCADDIKRMTRLAGIPKEMADEEKKDVDFIGITAKPVKEHTYSTFKMLEEELTKEVSETVEIVESASLDIGSEVETPGGHGHVTDIRDENGEFFYMVHHTEKDGDSDAAEYTADMIQSIGEGEVVDFEKSQIDKNGTANGRVQSIIDGFLKTPEGVALIDNLDLSGHAEDDEDDVMSDAHFMVLKHVIANFPEYDTVMHLDDVGDIVDDTLGRIIHSRTDSPDNVVKFGEDSADPYGGSMFSPYDDEPSDEKVEHALEYARGLAQDVMDSDEMVKAGIADLHGGEAHADDKEGTLDDMLGDMAGSMQKSLAANDMDILDWREIKDIASEELAARIRGPQMEDYSLEKGSYDRLVTEMILDELKLGKDAAEIAQTLSFDEGDVSRIVDAASKVMESKKK